MNHSNRFHRRPAIAIAIAGLMLARAAVQAQTMDRVQPTGLFLSKGCKLADVQK